MGSSREEIVISLKDEFSAAAKNINQAVSGIKVGIAGFAGNQIVQGIASSIKAFADAEKRTVQLGFALKSVGLSSKQTLDDYKNFADQIKRTTFFTDEQVISVERLLTQYGVYGEQMKRTIKIAADLATTTGGDLESSVKLLLRALENGGAGLSRLGFKISDTEIRAHGLDGILERLEKQLKGISEAAGNTTAAKIDQLEKAFDDLKKSAGGFFATIESKLGVMGLFTEAMDLATKKINGPQNELESLDKKISDIADRMKWMEHTKPFFGFQRGQWQKDFDDLSNELNKLINERSEILSKSIATPTLTSKKMPLFDEEAYKKAQSEFRSFLEKIQADKENSTEKIREAEIKLYHDLDDIYKKGYISYAQFLKGEEAIAKDASAKRKELMEKEITEFSNKVSSGSEAIINALEKDFASFAQNVGNMFGPIGTAIGQFFASTIRFATALGDLLAGDTRSNFEKLGSYIDELNQKMSAMFNLLDALAEKDRRVREGRDVTKKLSSEEIIEIEKKFGRLPNQWEWYGAEINFQVRESDGAVVLTINGLEFAGLRPNGEIETFQTVGLLNEQESADLAKYLFQTYLKDINRKPTQNRAQGGIITGSDDMVPAMLSSGEFVVNRRGVNQKTLGLLHALNAGLEPMGASQMITIHAIDAASFEQFMKRTGARVMRNMTAREGTVFIGSKGVSGNA